MPDEPEPSSILTDALELLCNQGELFIAAGIVFLDPGFATELLRPLVDHQLTSAADAKTDIEKYVSATPGLASETGLVDRLLGEIDNFVAMGARQEFSIENMGVGAKAEIVDANGQTMTYLLTMR